MSKTLEARVQVQTTDDEERCSLRCRFLKRLLNGHAPTCGLPFPREVPLQSDTHNKGFRRCVQCRDAVEEAGRGGK